ncbi:MAG TPA: 4-phosphoerythronate dehydrogenase [Bacteroidetes bacterium]|nr:4-phosphoerythronate dehydrogenase [Bacteroidota bacterium]
MLKITADEQIPFLRSVLEPYARVEYLPGNLIRKDHLKNTDALIIRTRTRCNPSLLEGTRIRFIATATIGYDHIDTGYCSRKGIAWANAPGCNASSVMQYMASVLAFLHLQKHISFSEQVLGIIGVGHVGKKVHQLASLMGIPVLLYDPPRARAEGRQGFSTLDEIFERATLLSFHVPLNRKDPDKTYHMGNAEFFKRMQQPFILINTARGEVLETRGVLEAMESGKIKAAVLDVWENEPHVDSTLLKNALIATSHIAGYSTEGKANGTAMSVRSLARHFGLPLENWYPHPLPEPGNRDIFPEGKHETEILCSALLKAYPVQQDSQKLKNNPGSFEQLRDHYPVRREYGAYRIHIQHHHTGFRKKLSTLGFEIR